MKLPDEPAPTKSEVRRRAEHPKPATELADCEAVDALARVVAGHRTSGGAFQSEVSRYEGGGRS